MNNLWFSHSLVSFHCRVCLTMNMNFGKSQAIMGWCMYLNQYSWVVAFLFSISSSIFFYSTTSKMVHPVGPAWHPLKFFPHYQLSSGIIAGGCLEKFQRLRWMRWLAHNNNNVVQRLKHSFIGILCGCIDSFEIFRKENWHKKLENVMEKKKPFMFKWWSSLCATTINHKTWVQQR